MFVSPFAPTLLGGKVAQMNRNTTLGFLIAIVVAHIVIAFGFASITPYRQAGALLGLGKPTKVIDIGAPDERQHVNYVIHLLAGKGFPIFDPNDPNLGETYQSHQPPAFYVTAMAWSKLTGASDLTKHDDGIKLRFLNVLMGAGTVLGVFCLAFWAFRKEEVALAAAAFAGFLPMFCALAGAISNDPMLILLCTWVLALTVKSLRDGWFWKQTLLIGLLTGLALLTKTTALALVPILLVAVILSRKFPADRSTEDSHAMPSPGMVMAAAVLALAMVGPWWARNQNLYHDPFAIKAFNDAFKGSAQKAQIVAGIEAMEPGGSSEMTYWKDWVGWWTSRSFFGVFGYMDIWMNERGTSFTGVSSKGAAPNTLYRVLLAFTALSFLGWVLSLGKDDWKESRHIQALNAIFFLIVLILFLRFNMQYFQAQARYLLPAMGPIACGFAVGLSQLTSKYRYAAAPILAAVFLGVNAYALTILPDEFKHRIEVASQLP